MYWQEENKEGAVAASDDVVDLAFRIVCRTLPVDHAYALSRAVLATLPWLAEDESAGVHTIHVAESGNGWMRPDRSDALLHLSRRTKLVLRLPKARLAEAKRLSGQTLDVAGNTMGIEESSVRPLLRHGAVYSRYVVVDEGEGENEFLTRVAVALDAMGIHPKKLLCGIEHVIVTPERPIRTRSLMVADLAPAESVTLQQRGLGPLRWLGCGLFIAHKDVKEVRDALD